MGQQQLTDNQLPKVIVVTSASRGGMVMPGVDLCVKNDFMGAWSCVCNSHVCGVNLSALVIERKQTKSVMDMLWLIRQCLVLAPNTPLILSYSAASSVDTAQLDQLGVDPILIPDTKSSKELVQAIKPFIHASVVS